MRKSNFTALITILMVWGALNAVLFFQGSIAWATDWSNTSQPVYTISTETLNGAVAAKKLQDAINAAGGITPTCISVGTKGDVAVPMFDAAVPSGEQAAVDAVLAAHDGVTPTPAKDQLLHLKSPDGSVWKITISDAGAFSASKI